MKQARMKGTRKNRDAAWKGDTRPSSSDSDPRWDRAQVRQLLRAGPQLIQDARWEAWARERGGIANIHEYLRSLPLSKEESLLLNLLLERPREAAETYAELLQISRPTYFYRLHHLLELLAAYLNVWEITPQQSQLDRSSEHLAAYELGQIPARPHAIQTPEKDPLAPKTAAKQVRPVSSHTIELIEREAELQAVLHFFDRCSSQTVLHIKGPTGSGRSRFLAEVAKLANQRGALVVHIAEAADQDDLPAGLLHEHAKWTLGDTDPKADPAAGRSTQEGQLLVLCIDNLPSLPIETIGTIRRLLQTHQPHKLVLLYTDDPDDLDVLAVAQQKHLTLSPFSILGVKQWIAARLGWAPEPALLTWLRDETGGRPAQLEQALVHLLANGKLQQTPLGWRCNLRLVSQSLAPYLRQDPTLPPHNLPRFPTSFIGRIQETNQLSELLQSNRLVTLMGLGGIGKTCLASYVVVLLRRRFADGVYMVSLSTITDPQHVIPLIAQTIGIKDEGHMPLMDCVEGVLADKHMLLVLDNVEHVLGCADQLTTLLDRTRCLTILVVSRERLWVQGEIVFRLDGLLYPSAASSTSETIDAVQLFRQRAQDVDPAFELTADQVPVVRHICRLVQGMPLAIELAAAWVRLLSCHEIAAKIAESMDFLVARFRDIPERHRSLRAVFDYSWNSLSPIYQAGFQQLSVFRGGFGHTAALAVAGMSLHLLRDLVDMLLIRCTQDDRYELHELLRQYAAAHLAASPELLQQTNQRHASYYLAFAEQAGVGDGGDRVARFAQLEREQGNLRAALQWSCTTCHTQLALRLCIALWPFWETQGYLSEGSTWLRAALACANNTSTSDEDKQLMAGCQQALGALYLLQGQYDDAQLLLEAADSTFSALGARPLLSKTSGLMGCIKLCQGDYARAGSLYRKQHDIALEHNQTDQRARALIGMGSIAFQQGDFGEALALWQQSRTLLPPNAGRLESDVTIGLGIAYLCLGAYEQAFDPLYQGIQIVVRYGLRVDLSRAIGNLGTLYTMYGQLDQALICFQRSLGLAMEVRHLLSCGWAMSWIGRILGERGELWDAMAYMNRSIALLRSLSLPYYLWSALDYQASLYRQQGQLLDAEAGLREALALAQAHGFDTTTRSREMVLQLLQVEVALGRRDVSDALQEIEQHSRGWTNGDLQAALSYTRWRIDPSRDADRHQAALQYAALHDTTPNALYRQRYHELTGQALLAPNPLPDPPSIVMQSGKSLSALLAAADQLMGSIAPSSTYSRS